MGYNTVIGHNADNQTGEEEVVKSAQSRKIVHGTWCLQDSYILTGMFFQI